MRAFVFQVQDGRGEKSLRQNYIYKEINIVTQLFRFIIPILLYLQLNRGSFESKHNHIMLLPLFKLTTCFGPCTGPSSGHKIYKFIIIINIIIINL